MDTTQFRETYAEEIERLEAGGHELEYYQFVATRAAPGYGQDTYGTTMRCVRCRLTFRFYPLAWFTGLVPRRPCPGTP